MCDKYDFVRALNGWTLPEGVNSMPNMAYESVHEGRPDIKNLFTHYYSFQNTNGEIYWSISPDDCGMSKEEIENALNRNYILCDVIPGVRSEHTILFKPMNVVMSCTVYAIEKNNKTFDIKRVNKHLGLNEVIVNVATEQEAKAFKMGYDAAYEHVTVMLSEKKRGSKAE